MFRQEIYRRRIVDYREISKRWTNHLAFSHDDDDDDDHRDVDDDVYHLYPYLYLHILLCNKHLFLFLSSSFFC